MTEENEKLLCQIMALKHLKRQAMMLLLAIDDCIEFEVDKKDVMENIFSTIEEKNKDFPINQLRKIISILNL